MKFSNQLVQAGNYEKALELYSLCSEKKESIECLVQAALCALKIDKNEEAIETIRRAVEIYPTVPVVHLTRAKIELELGNQAEALSAIKEAVLLNPEDTRFG